MLTIELPWPDRRLHPNARIHWRRKAEAAKTARADAHIACRAAGIREIKAATLSLAIVFHPPNRIRRDVDGMLSAIKPGLDGIADVIGVDDSNWQIAIRKAEPRPLGAVIIQIEVASCSP